MTVDISFAHILAYLLVWIRLAGMILFNPMLARVSIPTQVRMGLVFFLSLLIAPLQPEGTIEAVYSMHAYTYIFVMVLELAIGFVYGFIFQIFYYLLYFVGDAIDTDIGLSMAKTMDPSTNIQTGFSSSIVTLLFSLFLFASGSHLALFRIFASSFTAIPVATFTLSTNVIAFVLDLFGQVFLLALRLLAPFMVAEFVLQFSMGVLMKFIPQITVFVINFQLRIILGLLLLYAFTPYIGQFIDRYLDALFNNLVYATQLMAGG